MTWTPDRPTKPGKYELSLHPDARAGLPVQMTAEVAAMPDWLRCDETDAGLIVRGDVDAGTWLIELSSSRLDRALWRPYVEPADPHAQPVPSLRSRVEGLPWKSYRMSDDPMTPNLRLILDADVGIVTLYEADMTSRSDTAQETERHDKIVMSPDDARWLRDQLVALLESEGM